MADDTTDSTRLADETLARITELAKQAAQAQAQVARDSFDLARATVTGEVDRSKAGRAYVEAVSREGARYWRDVGALGLDYGSELLSLSTRAATRVIGEVAGVRSRRASEAARDTASDEAGRGGRGADARDAGGAGVREVPLVLRAAPGETARGTATVVNQHPRARRIELTPGEMHAADGSPVGLPFRVDPRRVTVAASAEHEVAVEVDLDPSIARPGERYRGTVAVTGGDEASIEVAVEVTG